VSGPALSVEAVLRVLAQVGAGTAAQLAPLLRVRPEPVRAILAVAEAQGRVAVVARRLGSATIYRVVEGRPSLPVDGR